MRLDATWWQKYSGNDHQLGSVRDSDDDCSGWNSNGRRELGTISQAIGVTVVLRVGLRRLDIFWILLVCIVFVHNGLFQKMSPDNS